MLIKYNEHRGKNVSFILITMCILTDVYNVPNFLRILYERPYLTLFCILEVSICMLLLSSGNSESQKSDLCKVLSQITDKTCVQAHII